MISFCPIPKDRSVHLPFLFIKNRLLDNRTDFELHFFVLGFIGFLAFGRLRYSQISQSIVVHMLGGIYRHMCWPTPSLSAQYHPNCFMISYLHRLYIHFFSKNSPTGKLIWQWKMTIFNGRYIVKWLVFQSVMLAVLRGLLPRQSFGQTPVPGVTLTLHIGVGFGPLKLLQLGHVNAGQKTSEDGSKSTGIWWFCMVLRWVCSIYTLKT